MNALKNVRVWCLFIMLSVAVACSDDDDNNAPVEQKSTIMVENVLASQPLVQSGTFQGTGSPALIFPGQSTTITFYAAKGEALTFATMYGWSNDLFFAPANPGITVYDANGNPIEGDVSSQVKLWDNGTRMNQKPGSAVTHPGTADSQNITEVKGSDAQGNDYLAASSLMKCFIEIQR